MLMLKDGVKQGKSENILTRPITTIVGKDSVKRYWRYADFELDYMLAQQFNFEYLILNEAREKNCQHIAPL